MRKIWKHGALDTWFGFAVVVLLFVIQLIPAVMLYL